MSHVERASGAAQRRRGRMNGTLVVAPRAKKYCCSGGDPKAPLSWRAPVLVHAYAQTTFTDSETVLSDLLEPLVSTAVYAAPAPATKYVPAPSPVIEPIVPTPAVTFSSPAPVIKNVFLHLMTPTFRGLLNPQFSATSVEVSTSKVVGPPLHSEGIEEQIGDTPVPQVVEEQLVAVTPTIATTDMDAWGLLIPGT